MKSLCHWIKKRFLVSGGRIDHGHHANWAKKALRETVAMNQAVAKAIEVANKGANDV